MRVCVRVCDKHMAKSASYATLTLPLLTLLPLDSGKDP